MVNSKYPDDLPLVFKRVLKTSKAGGYHQQFHRFHQEVFVGNSIPDVSGYLMLSRARQLMGVDDGGWLMVPGE